MVCPGRVGRPGRTSWVGNLMQTIAITDEELELLRGLLQHEMNQMEVEILRTDTREYKEMLRRRRETLNRLLTRLALAPQPA